MSGNPYHLAPQCQVQTTTMDNREIERRSRLLKAQVGDVLLEENIFGEQYVSFKSQNAKNVCHVFENENLTDFELPIVQDELSPQNYLYVIYNGKSPHAVRSSLRDAGYIACDRASPRFNIYWGIVQGPRFYQGLAPGQLANSWPGSTWFTQKNKLASTVNGFQQRTGIAGVIPKSFKLTEEMNQLIIEMNQHPEKFYIFKPIMSSRGANIQLLNYQIPVPDREAIVQEYLENPLLLRGYKFDLRTYVVIFQIDPLVIYIFKEGMGRFCTSKYQNPTMDNFQNARMHLTNFEVNRFNNEEPPVLYVGDTDESQILDLDNGFLSKQSLTEVFNVLDRERSNFRTLKNFDIPLDSYPGDGHLRRALWRRLKENIKHVLIAAEPYLHWKAQECGLLHQYPRRNYGMYGFDHIITADGDIHCLEINVLPSMETTTYFDHRLKFPLLQNLFELIQPVVKIRNDMLVVPATREIMAGKQGHMGTWKGGRNVEVIWEELTDLEQRAIAEVTEAEKRLGDFERIMPDGDERTLDLFQEKRYMNELLGAWTRQNGI